MWPWRDWVINAFNTNMPFDEFAIEQLAGDLLPNATRDQKIASGFNRNHMINFEGGAIADEYQVEYVVDRVEATSSAFMGLTMGCARCHSHKFDPITPQGVLRVLRVFQQRPRSSGWTARPATPCRCSRCPPPSSSSGSTSSTRRSARARARWPTASSLRCSTSGRRPSPRSRPSRMSTGLLAHYELDGNFSDISGRYQHGRTIVGDPTFDAGKWEERCRSMATRKSVSETSARFDRADPFSLAVWLKGRGNLPISVFQKLDGPDHRRGYEWQLDDIALIGIQKWAARLTVRIMGDSPDSAIEIRTRERLAARRLVPRGAHLRRLRQGRRSRALSQRHAARR